MHIYLGVGEPGSRLEAVILMMRHGDRGPMHPFRNLTSINCGYKNAENLDFQEYLRFASSHIQSRPARDAFRRFPIVPKGNFCLSGQLTEVGTQQQFQTGRLFREVYINQNHLLRDNWGMEDVVVCSTMVERTYQSAISFLYGFLPKFDFAKLNIKVGLGSLFCYSQQLCHCPLIDKLNRAVEKDKAQYVTSHPAVQSLVEHINSILRVHNSHFSSPTNPDDVFDKLLVYVCHHASLPCYNEHSCVTVEQLNNVISFLEWRGKQLAISHNVKVLSRLSIQGFLTDVLQRLLDIQHQRKKHRFIFYSAHDKTLMPLLVSFGVFDGIRPPFSSRFVMELHSKPVSSVGKNEKERIYHLKIIYNGKDVTKKTNFCFSKKREREPSFVCPLDNFVKFVQEDYLKEMNASSFKAACVAPTPEPDW